MSLPHVAQACGIVDGLRRKRHNNIVLFVAQSMVDSIALPVVTAESISEFSSTGWVSLKLSLVWTCY